MVDHDAEQAAAIASRLRRNEVANLDTVRKAKELLATVSQGSSSGTCTRQTLPALHELAALLEREERR